MKYFGDETLVFVPERLDEKVVSTIGESAFQGNMERFAEMENGIQDFRTRRMDTKRAYLDGMSKQEMLFFPQLPVINRGESQGYPLTV